MVDTIFSCLIFRANVGLDKSHPSKKLGKVGANSAWGHQESIQCYSCFWSGLARVKKSQNHDINMKVNCILFFEANCYELNPTVVQQSKKTYSHQMVLRHTVAWSSKLLMTPRTVQCSDKTPSATVVWRSGLFSVALRQPVVKAKAPIPS